MRRNDELEDPRQLAHIRQEARHALERAGAMGVFPTPVADIIEAAEHAVEEREIDDRFLSKARRKVSGALKRAMSKIIGVLDVASRTMHLDKTVHVAKRPFLMLHELGHGVLPWQREMYAITLDCDKTISPDVADLFEQESNAFASEVLFQLDNFTAEASNHAFALKTPLSLARKYGSSVYSAVRRFVHTNARSCAVIVLNPPKLSDGQGFVATVRRVIVSPSFARQFGSVTWPTTVTPDDMLGKLIPIGRRMSRPQTIPLNDCNGQRHECVAEAFDSTHQVFILVSPQAALTRKVILAPA